MGAPVWSPGPDALDDQEAEREIVARFFFAPPPRLSASGEAAGAPLPARGIAAWLRLLTGRDLEVGVSDPPSTDGRRVFLPATGPVDAGEAALWFRCLALCQAGLVHFGLLDDRPLLASLHADPVLRSTWHLLALGYLVRRWSEEYPGIAADFAGLRILPEARGLRVNLTAVPSAGMPGAFLPLYGGLVALDEVAGPEGDPARRAVAAVDGIRDPRAAAVVLQGQAWALRLEYRRRRLGPPPLPSFAGLLRPEWLLDPGDLPPRQDWRPRPLGILRRGAREEVGPPAPVALPAEEGRVYDEWDAGRGAWRTGAVRVLETEAPGGPIEPWERLAAACAAEITLARRRFALLAREERWAHGQPDGTDVDTERAVAAMADVAAGFTPRPDWHLRFERRRLPVALLVLVDLSGSTAGEVIRNEQAALVVLGGALPGTGIAHAFWGFSSDGPAACRLARIQGWGEPGDEAVRRRIGNLRPGGSTRLGAFVRHGAWMLGRRPEPRRVMLVLSDGRPHDAQGYVGEAAVADSALAVAEARRQGVLVHALSLDAGAAAEGYLDRVFGAGRYMRLPRVDLLPRRLAEVTH